MAQQSNLLTEHIAYLEKYVAGVYLGLKTGAFTDIKLAEPAPLVQPVHEKKFDINDWQDHWKQAEKCDIETIDGIREFFKLMVGDFPNDFTREGVDEYHTKLKTLTESWRNNQEIAQKIVKKTDDAQYNAKLYFNLLKDAAQEPQDIFDIVKQICVEPISQKALDITLESLAKKNQALLKMILSAKKEKILTEEKWKQLQKKIMDARKELTRQLEPCKKNEAPVPIDLKSQSATSPEPTPTKTQEELEILKTIQQLGTRIPQRNDKDAIAYSERILDKDLKTAEKKYKKLALVMHPDKLAKYSEDIKEKGKVAFQIISNAMDILKNPPGKTASAESSQQSYEEFYQQIQQYDITTLRGASNLFLETATWPKAPELDEYRIINKESMTKAYNGLTSYLGQKQKAGLSPEEKKLVQKIFDYYKQAKNILDLYYAIESNDPKNALIVLKLKPEDFMHLEDYNAVYWAPAVVERVRYLDNLVKPIDDQYGFLQEAIDNMRRTFANYVIQQQKKEFMKAAFGYK